MKSDADPAVLSLFFSVSLARGRFVGSAITPWFSAARSSGSPAVVTAADDVRHSTKNTIPNLLHDDPN